MRSEVGSPGQEQESRIPSGTQPLLSFPLPSLAWRQLPSRKREGGKPTYSAVDPGLEEGKASVVEGIKYEGIAEASESLVKIIANGDQAEQERR